MKTYEEFISITNLENGAYKSIFMHLNEITTSLHLLKLDKLILNAPESQVSNLVYKLTPGNSLPKPIFSLLYLLFTDPSLISEELEVILEFTYKDKVHTISVIHGQYFITDDNLIDLFTSKSYFNFMDGVHLTNNFLNTYEKMFSFLIKKDLPYTVDSSFELQMQKYLNNNLTTFPHEIENDVSNKEILIEKLIKNRNTLFTKVASLNKQRLELSDEKSKLDNYYQNKDQNELKYQSLSDDYKRLTQQEKTFYKNVADIQGIINKIDIQLESINDFEQSMGVPEEEREGLKEKKEFFLNKKAAMQSSLSESEANLYTISEMVSSTKMQMDALYSDLDVINRVNVDENSTYDNKIFKLNKDIDEIYMDISSLDTEISLLQKDIAALDIAEDYRNIKNTIPNDVERTAIVNSLNKNIIPNSINVVYKYLCNLFLFHTKTYSVKDALFAMDIKVNNFFMVNAQDNSKVDII